MDFHLPYQFVPFDRKAKRMDVPRERLQQRQEERLTHDRYAKGARSGRIVCRLVTESPTVVGANRSGRSGHAARVEPFRLLEQVAVPGSTLRGMISSVAEAASNSALRVLTDRGYSYRKPMDPAVTLSAIGMVVQTDKGWTLFPISLPTLEADRSGVVTLPKEYQPLFPKPLLKVYIGNSAEIRREQFDLRTTVFETDRHQWHYMPLSGREWLPGFRLQDDAWQHRKPDKSRRYLLAQKSITNEVGLHLPKGSREEIPEQYQKYAVAGAVRVLGCWGDRTDDIPTGKRHELFLPWPVGKDWPQVPIPQEVVERFHQLCDERTEGAGEKDPPLPFEPKDTRPGRRKRDKLRLKHGDLVYFRPNANGTAVAEISFSAIWRGRVEKSAARRSTTYDFFPRELSPFREGKAELTPADLLFGFVEEMPEVEGAERNERPQAMALASRVRFSNGLLNQAESGTAASLLPSVLLKVLDSPKPPSPALYFQQRGGNPAYIAKGELSADRNEAQGRKVYLHHREAERLTQPWKTQRPGDNLSQKSEVQPMRAGLSFNFHLDYKNLSDYELGMLLYALRPTEQFRHKLGMGKALGLGTVRVDVMGVFEIDRERRYSEEGFFEPRYRTVAAGVPASHFPEAYGEEREALAGVESHGSLEALRTSFAESMSQRIKQALETLGDPGKVTAPVLQPLVEGQHPEEETFQWFVANEVGWKDNQRGQEIPVQKQFLAPVSDRIPVLRQPRKQPIVRGRW